MKPYDWLINGNEDDVDDDEFEHHNDVVDDEEELVPLRIDHRLTLPV